MPDYGHDLKFGYFLKIVGPVDHWVQMLEHLAADFGFSMFLLVSPPDPHALRTFMGEVAPRVRERVAARRAAEQETRV